MYWRIHVSESPFVGRKLAVGVHIPFAKEQSELFLGEVGIDLGQWDAMERQIPRSVPWIFPLVGHRDDVGVVKIAPFVIPALFSTLRGRRAGRSWFHCDGPRNSLSLGSVQSLFRQRAPWFGLNHEWRGHGSRIFHPLCGTLGGTMLPRDRPFMVSRALLGLA